MKFEGCKSMETICKGQVKKTRVRELKQTKETEKNIGERGKREGWGSGSMLKKRSTGVREKEGTRAVIKHVRENKREQDDTFSLMVDLPHY